MYILNILSLEFLLYNLLHIQRHSFFSNKIILFQLTQLFLQNLIMDGSSAKNLANSELNHHFRNAHTMRA